MQGLNHDSRPGFSPQPTPPRKGWARPQAGPGRPRRDPAPSRLAYRLNRLWLRPRVRRLVRVGLPVFVIALIVLTWASDDARRAGVSGRVNGIVEQIQNREQFQVHLMTIEGASEPVDRALRALLPVDLPASSFDIDLESLRRDILGLDAVREVDLRIRPGGVLFARVTEREPVLLWRHARGIDLLDGEGHRITSIMSREMRPELPLIAGEGGNRAAAEAMELFRAAEPVIGRVRGLQRMGERRWDVILDRGQRIMLPADEPVAALERALALDTAQHMLARNITVVDMRDAARPVVRMGLDARNQIRRARGQPELGLDGRPVDQGQG
ncbi:MAG: cell division protein FtsQ/DivIB [Paracoccus sp. (in: a-proteobacteria)]|nr:cell division protein FtsQ/DivIB [Paracoccus sp. (in: a-proteobacteria)]